MNLLCDKYTYCSSLSQMLPEIIHKFIFFCMSNFFYPIAYKVLLLFLSEYLRCMPEPFGMLPFLTRPLLSTLITPTVVLAFAIIPNLYSVFIPKLTCSI